MRGPSTRLGILLALAALVSAGDRSIHALSDFDATLRALLVDKPAPTATEVRVGPDTRTRSGPTLIPVNAELHLESPEGQFVFTQAMQLAGYQRVWRFRDSGDWLIDQVMSGSPNAGESVANSRLPEGSTAFGVPGMPRAKAWTLVVGSQRQDWVTFDVDRYVFQITYVHASSDGTSEAVVAVAQRQSEAAASMSTGRDEGVGTDPIDRHARGVLLVAASAIAILLTVFVVIPGRRRARRGRRLALPVTS